MIPDPNTKEGLEEIERRVAKRRQEARKYREMSETDVDEEPSGKLTNPSEFDRHRDRKDDD